MNARKCEHKYNAVENGKLVCVVCGASKDIPKTVEKAQPKSEDKAKKPDEDKSKKSTKSKSKKK